MSSDRGVHDGEVSVAEAVLVAVEVAGPAFPRRSAQSETVVTRLRF
jgi:hypothetical protein